MHRKRSHNRWTFNVVLRFLAFNLQRNNQATQVINSSTDASLCAQCCPCIVHVSRHLGIYTYTQRLKTHSQLGTKQMAHTVYIYSTWHWSENQSVFQPRVYSSVTWTHKGLCLALTDWIATCTYKVLIPPFLQTYRQQDCCYAKTLN